MGGHSGGGGRSGRSGGDTETYSTPVGEMSISTTQTEWGERYQIKDANGYVMNMGAVGYSDKFATKEKARAALEKYVNLRLGQARQEATIKPLPFTQKRVIASEKQKKYIKDLADKKGVSLNKEFGLTKEKIKTMSSKQASYVIRSLKEILNPGDYTGDYMENL